MIIPICPHRREDNDELHQGKGIRLSLELSESNVWKWRMREEAGALRADAGKDIPHKEKSDSDVSHLPH